ncbi:hypothetical protein V1517DRAFT_133164 [Lipomyces orientalis]|uniref:Uncharacterized protein n=1 Tax=Lipomyces orientalis TaxID=1233043 RepID=A0ACC3TMZ3_9ASCO
MSLLAYISTNNNNNNNSSNHHYHHYCDSCQTPTQYSLPSNVHTSPYPQSRFSLPPQRHDQEGAHSIAKERELESLTASGRSLPPRLSPSYSGWSLRNHDKFSTLQMADELRLAAEDPYEQRAPQKQHQQLLDPASLGQFAGMSADFGRTGQLLMAAVADNEEDISPTRLPSIQTLLTTASTSAPSAPATSESGGVANASMAPSVSSTPTAAAEGIARSSISSNTSSNSTASAPARLSPTMTTTSTTSTPTAQSGYDPASGSTPQARTARMLQVSSASMAAAAAMQMPTSAYPQPAPPPPLQQQHQQQYMYPGPLPAMAAAPQIHPPPLPPHYMAAALPPQPYYIPAPQGAQSAYPAAATSYAVPPHPALTHHHPALRPVQLAPGMPLPMAHGMPGMPAAQTHLSPLKPKRKRATQHQVNRLNEVFQQTFFPSTEQRLELSRELGMTPRTVQIWFQNRRQGWRAESRRTSGGEGHGSHSDQQHQRQQQHGHMPGESMEGEYDLSE